MSKAYYNENDPRAADWLRNLIAIGAIADGDVDGRSIEDVRPSDLHGYTQCHFFAGIGGWSYALRLAGWPDDRPVWTGSCPCQPFSVAGRRKGNADSRHLFPAWHWLVGQRRPAVLFGEQVASKAGREWLTGVRLALEALGYGVGAADLCAAGVGAPHIRQRLYWVADTDSERREGQHALLREETAGRESGHLSEAAGRGESSGGLADTTQQRRERGGHVGPGGRCEHSDGSGLGDTSGAGTGRDSGAVSGAEAQSGGERQEARSVSDSAVDAGGAGRLGDTERTGLEGHAGDVADGHEPEPGRQQTDATGSVAQASGDSWRDAIWIPCADGKARRIEPGIEPLAHGIPGRVGLLRGYGNAIVPQLAADFISAYLET